MNRSDLVTLRSLSEEADLARLIPRMRVANAEWHVADVRSRFGSMSIEYRAACLVLQAEHGQLLETYGDGLARASGVPEPRCPTCGNAGHQAADCPERVS